METGPFVKLSFSKATAVKFEVDNVIRLFRKYRAEARDLEVEALKDAITARIQELKEFCQKNADYSATREFEYQHRRLVREVSRGSPSARGASQHSLKPSGPGSSAQTLTLEELRKRRGRSQTSGANLRLPAKGNSGGGAAATTRPRPALHTEEGTFYPSRIPGIYVQSNGLDKNATESLHVPSGSRDFQVVLTEQEYQSLQHRRRQLTAEEKHKARFKRDDTVLHSFLRSQIPFVDGDRITRGIYRPSDSAKWVSSNNFSVF